MEIASMTTPTTPPEGPPSENHLCGSDGQFAMFDFIPDIKPPKPTGKGGRKKR